MVHDTELSEPLLESAGELGDDGWLPSPGAVVGSHFQVVKYLGEGAMGAVALAMDLVLDRYVALKLVKAAVARRLHGSERFRREARMLSRMHHPNLVTIHGFGEEPSGLSYIVMEYVEGRSLRDVLQLDGPLGPEAFCHVLTQIAHALTSVHERGVVHRDLKPANVLVTSVAGDPLHIKVADFGLAKVFDMGQHSGRDTGLSGLGAAMGTPQYIAPEQAQGEEVDHRADIYALGVMACELLTGRVPIEAASAMGLMIAHVSDAPVLPSELRPDLGIPPGGALDTTVARCLAKAAGERQPDTATFVRELVAAVQDWRGSSGPSPPFEAPARVFPAETAETLESSAVVTEANAPVLHEVAALLVAWEDATPQGALEPGDRLDCIAHLHQRTRRAVTERGGGWRPSARIACCRSSTPASTCGRRSSRPWTPGWPCRRASPPSPRTRRSRRSCVSASGSPSTTAPWPGGACRPRATSTPDRSCLGCVASYAPPTMGSCTPPTPPGAWCVAAMSAGRPRGTPR